MKTTISLFWFLMAVLLGAFSLKEIQASPEGPCYSNPNCKAYLPMIEMPVGLPRPTPTPTPTPVPYAPSIVKYEYYPIYSQCFLRGEIKNTSDFPVYDVTMSASWGSTGYKAFTTILSATTSYTNTPFWVVLPLDCPNEIIAKVEDFKVDFDKRFVPITSTLLLHNNPEYPESYDAILTNTLDVKLEHVQAAIWDYGDNNGSRNGWHTITSEVTLQPGQAISLTWFRSGYLPSPIFFSAQGVREEP
ncbi:MAG TPA: hypothetical protein PL141_01405 [Thermoflexales bacterium]|nr:hypothetical protein [Thermoflexales bacterium]